MHDQCKKEPQKKSAKWIFRNGVKEKASPLRSPFTIHKPTLLFYNPFCLFLVNAQ